jgi:hypothetical protein
MIHLLSNPDSCLQFFQLWNRCTAIAKDNQQNQLRIIGFAFRHLGDVSDDEALSYLDFAPPTLSSARRERRFSD